MKSNLISAITERMPTLSKGQKRIARFILEHYDSAAFMTANKLGREVQVSESTVVRFATELGYDGYPRLQKAMQELVRSKLTSLQRMEITRSRMRDDEVLDNIMACDIANVRQTLDEMPREVFNAAVDAIVNARRVYIFGAGSCRALANFIAYYLKMLLVDIHLIYTSSETEIFEEMLHIDERDAIIGVSFPRYSSKAVKAMHFAHSRGAKVIAITDTPASPIAELASYLLLAHSDMATVVDSLVAPLSVINALSVAASLRKMDSVTQTLTELEELWDQYDVYQKYSED